MATAEARTTLLSSVFMSATVCRTVDSNVASSMTSTPAFAWPRATWPSRLKISVIKAIVVSLTLLSGSQLSEHAPRHQHVHQQEVDAGQNVVLILRVHILQNAEVVQGNGDLAAGFVELEVRSGNAIVRRQHPPHHLGCEGRCRHRGARQRKEKDVALEDGPNGNSAIHLFDT